VSTPAADEPPGALAPVPAVRLLTSAELLRGAFHDLPGAHEPGSVRTAYPGLAATTFRSTLVVMPVGQRSPERTSDIEHVIVGIEGAFVFTIDGVDYRLGELDQLLVPIGVRWEYRNDAPSDSTYLSIVGP
jgi:quercetin dioxygenase-like cupin family protein